jgi:hypothetical protein
MREATCPARKADISLQNQGGWKAGGKLLTADFRRLFEYGRQGVATKEHKEAQKIR